MRKIFPSFENTGLIHRWLIFNTLMLSLFAAVQLQEGWLGDLANADTYYISHSIFLIFVIALVVSGIKALRINEMSKHVGGFIAGHKKLLEDKGQDARGDLREALKTDLMAYISIVGEVSGYLIFFGMLGTVVGLILATVGIDPESISDPTNAGITVSQVLSGFSIALHTTLVGGITGVWLKINHYMLIGSTARLFSKILRG